MVKIKQTASLLAVLALMLPALAGPVLGDDSIFIQEGKQLYTTLCSGCHGDVDDSAKAGRSMSRIRSALRMQATHQPLAKLSDEDILLIAMALREESE